MSGIDPNRSGVLVVGGGGASLSDATPQPTGTAAAGVSTSAARADHVHAASVAAADISDAGTTGIALVQASTAAAARTTLAAVPTTRTLAGLDLSADRSATDLRTAIGAAAAGAAPGPAAIYNAASGGAVGLQTSVSAGSWFFRFWGWVRDASGSAVANARGIVHIIADTATLSSSADAYSGTVLQYARPGSSGATYAAIAFETDAAGKFDLRTNYTAPGASVKVLVQIGNAVTTASGTVT